MFVFNTPCFKCLIVFNNIAFQSALPLVCDGVSGTNWRCCSSSAPCGVGEGDCDNSQECKSGSFCGENNCKNDYSSNSSNWDSSADCCVALGKHVYVSIGSSSIDSFQNAFLYTQFTLNKNQRSYTFVASVLCKIAVTRPSAQKGVSSVDVPTLSDPKIE